MSPESKKLKVTSLITMAAGLVALAAGIFLLATGVDFSDVCVIASAVLTTFIGAKAARAANVPSNAAGLLGPAGVCAAANAVLLGGDFAFGNGQVLPVVVGLVVFVLVLLVALFARTIKRALERV